MLHCTPYYSTIHWNTSEIVLTFHFTRSDSGLVASTDTSIGGPLGAVSTEKITIRQCNVEKVLENVITLVLLTFL
jgi:hypothetical protein